MPDHVFWTIVVVMIGQILYTIGFKRLGYRLKPTAMEIFTHLLVGMLYLPVAVLFLIQKLFEFGKNK